MSGPHRRHLEALELDPDRLGPIERYLELLAAWSHRINLTGARTAEDRVRILVAPVVPAAPLLAGRLLDIGSGNGSPGLVLAALRPDLPAALLEPRGRRWAFLREACRIVGRPDIDVLRVRHDAYTGPAAGTITLRAVGLPLETLEPLLAAAGQVIVFGGTPDVGPDWVEVPATAGLRRFRRR